MTTSVAQTLLRIILKNICLTTKCSSDWLSLDIFHPPEMTLSHVVKHHINAFFHLSDVHLVV